MVSRLLYKNTLVKIKKSFGRYLSLFIIVMVGVGFYAGIQATAPDIIATADRYINDHHLADFKIVSTMGLTDDDVHALKNVKNVKDVFPSYSLDVLDQHKAIRVHAIEQSINTVKLSTGRMPQNENECVADSRTYKVGDKITITSDVSDKLKNTDFTVTGTVESVLYLAEDYGSTTVGDGKLSSYIFINRSNFILDAYTEIYITAVNAENLTAYSKAYDNVVSLLNDDLSKIKIDRESARYQKIYNTANEVIRENEDQLNNEKAKGRKELADAKAELDKNAQSLKAGKEELEKNEAELQKSIQKQNAEFDAARAKITEGWKEIDSALALYTLEKDELNSKMNELRSAIEAMQAQQILLPSGSPEYAQLSAEIEQYTAQYEGLLKLKQSVDTLAAQEAKLNKGIETFQLETEKARDQIEKGKNEIAQNEKKLSDAYKEYYENEEKFNAEISNAEAKLQDAKEKLSDIEQPKWHILNRDMAVGYSELKAGIDVVAAVATVFPLFFILIGMLMTSNSMARMITEERGELGTLASLGYNDGSIISTYLFYVLSASGLGAVTGFFIGCRIIPPLIYSNYQFILQKLVIQYNIVTFSLILVVTLMLMAMVTLIACNRELKQKPAALMRPLPPKKGQVILLERITPVWNRLSFTWKVTMRNLFRYKKRAFMTIVGVAGCTSLLLVGFGIRDSMDGIAEKQYGEIFRYDSMMILKDETQAIGGALEKLLATEKIESPLLLKQAAFKCETSNKSLDAFLIVPENEDIFYSYYTLQSTTDGTPLTLKDSGVVITQKLAEVFKVNPGDTIPIKDTDKNTYRLTITGVTENYTANYIYMNPVLYRKVFGKPASYNAIVSGPHADETTLAARLIDSGLVLKVVFTSDMMQKVLDSNQSLNGVILLIVAVASLLAIVVLYNLTSINISERTREIATLKVLGFHDEETNSYIYREAFLLTLISIGAGFVLGIFLHRYVVDIVGGTSYVFFKEIKGLSFVLSCLLTLVFSAIMQVVTYYKLRTIDMIESLKSVE